MGDSRQGRTRLLIVLLIVWSANLFWFALSSPVTTETPVRIVLGTLMIFLVPGLIWGELLRFRSRHPWETIAVAFSLSVLIELILLPIPFIFHATIELWIGLLLGVTLLGLGLLWLPVNRIRPWQFLPPLLRLPRRSLLSWSILLIPLAMAAWAYGAGEDLFDICGEKMLHMMFVRYYHEMPLQLHDLGVRPGIAPPNLVNLWEFLIAGWSRLIHVDPLIIFFRARFAIPILGLAGLFLLVRMIFVRRAKVEAIFFGVLLMCLANLLLRAPTMGWVQAVDPTRGVFAFLGTVHHADPAIDILIALGCGLGVRMVRRPTPGNAALLIGILTASFLWHPREFLQLALYLGVFGVAIVMTPALRKWRVLRNWALTTALLVGLAGVLLFASTKLVSQRSHAYDEMKIKKAALQYAAMPENVVGVRNFFHIPYLFMMSRISERDTMLTWNELNSESIEPSWQLDIWLLLSGLGVVVLAVFGRREDRGLAAHYFWLWFLALAWNCSMLVVFALTYSEFFMVTQRLLYLFAYIVIADMVLTMPRILACLASGKRQVLLLGLGALGGGVALWLWQRYGLPGAKRLSLVLTILMWGAAAWMPIDRRRRSALAPRSTGIALGWIALLFFLPLLADRAYHVVRDQSVMRRDQPNWFADDNPFGFSGKLIAWMRALPARQMFLVHPDGRDCIHAYAPHYEAIFPVTTLLLDFPVRHAVASGEHPLLVKNYSPGAYAVKHEQAKAWLKENGVNYLLLNHEYYDNYLRDYIDAHPLIYQVAFHDPAHRELVVRFVPQS